MTKYEALLNLNSIPVHVEELLAFAPELCARELIGGLKLSDYIQVTEDNRMAFAKYHSTYDWVRGEIQMEKSNAL